MNYGAKILLVDESAVLRALASVALGGVSGFSVTNASSAREALELATAGSFDAVVADQGLTGLSGLQLVRELKSRAGYRAVPMVLLVDDEEASIEREALSSGVAAVVRKPFNPAELRSRISQAIDESRMPTDGQHVRMLGVQSVLDSIPYPAMVLTAGHEVVLANDAFWRTTQQGIGDCAVDCRASMHVSGAAPHNCPLIECVRSGGPVERVVDEPGQGELLVCVYPMADEGDTPLFLHLTRPAASQG